MSMPTSQHPPLHYVVFDKKTGRILQRHSRFDVAKNAHVSISTEELKARFSGDPRLASRATEGDPNNVDVLEIKLDPGAAISTGDFVVDVQKRQLVPLPLLVLQAGKAALNGDGQDKTTLTIQALDTKGKAVKTLQGSVKVTTSRGKLSAPGGVVQLARGSATIELTAANETVSRVKVTASTPDGSCTGASLTLEFL